MNGVLRGSGYRSPSMELRDGGRRYQNYSKSQSAESLGFRSVNGVDRGGFFNNNASLVRCGGYRNRGSLSNVHNGIGFL